MAAHVIAMNALDEEAAFCYHALHAAYRTQVKGQHGNKRKYCHAQVAAACLYIVCRQDSKPFMLIDFSDALQINVFMLGNVFLQLCKLLRLQEQPMFTR